LKNSGLGSNFKCGAYFILQSIHLGEVREMRQKVLVSRSIRIKTGEVEVVDKINK
jgi:hypothetical protein